MPDTMSAGLSHEASHMVALHVGEQACQEPSRTTTQQKQCHEAAREPFGATVAAAKGQCRGSLVLL